MSHKAQRGRSTFLHSLWSNAILSGSVLKNVMKNKDGIPVVILYCTSRQNESFKYKPKSKQGPLHHLNIHELILTRGDECKAACCDCFLQDCHWCKIEHHNSWNEAVVASIMLVGPELTTLWTQMPNGPNSLCFNLQLRKDAYHRGTLSSARWAIFPKHIPENELLKCMRGLSVY